MDDTFLPNPNAIELRVFGGVDLRGPEGSDVRPDLHQSKRQALLVYLALASPRGFQRRDSLTALFWPELDEVHARNALSQAIHVLRRTLGAGVVVNRGPEEVGLDGNRLWCDAVAFERALDGDHPAEALELYQGDLLEGFFLSGTLEFERWIEDERSRLKQRAREAAWGLSRQCEREGDAVNALRWARRAAELAPDDELSLQGLVLLLDRAGNRAAALHAYDQFARRLEEDYAAEPSPETQALVRSIRERQAPRPSRSPRVESEPGDADPPVPAGDERSIPRPFAARAIVLALLSVLLLAVEDQGRVGRGEFHPGPGAVVAVLPFRVLGPQADLWREGMVDLLSTNLDGVAGMRAIDPRVVLSRWRDRIGEGAEAADRDEAFRVARETGAGYALMGTLVASKAEVRLIGEMYDLQSGRLRVRSQVEGAPDSILVLIDRLSLEVLRSGLAQEALPLPRLDVRRITTHSLPAMKAYLEGERAFRRNHWAEAIAGFEQAAESDTTFAFAYYRLTIACSWEVVSCDVGMNYDSLAMRFADRLPERDAQLIRANALWWPATAPEALQAFRRFVERYPDDVEGWYLYGDIAHHVHVPEWPDVPRRLSLYALGRAIDLDPGFGPAYIHLVPEAFARNDTSRASALASGLRDIDPAGAEATATTLAYRLAFGDPASRASTVSALDAAETEVLMRMEWLPLGEATSPAHLEEGVLVANALTAEHRPLEARQQGQRALIEIYASRGRFREAAEATTDFPGTMPKGAARMILMSWLSDLRVRANLDRVVGALTLQTAPADHYLLGALAARQGRWDDFELAVAALQESARYATPQARAVREREQQVLRGLAASIRGDRRSAIRLIEGALPRMVGTRVHLLRYELGKLWLAEGDPRRAVGYLESIEYLVPAINAPVELYLGRAYEALGEPDRARVHYARFVSWWQDCDPELEPLRAEGRHALDRLIAAVD
ncbi:MAG TPA: BTAD domain-containing putative transcriptional regulator [Gemmatimonadota bacterium]|nr:BTAD domain-containing putative transcriptional regulator [Gemmatimonadota bacterium]